MQRDPTTGSTLLAPREREVVALSAKGLIDKQIAAELGIRLSTVRSYWVRILNKTGAHGRPEAIAVVAKSELDVAEDSHRKLAEELRQQIHFSDDRFAALGEVFHSLIWFVDADLLVQARYGPEPPNAGWAEDIRVDAVVGDAFRRSGHGRAVAGAHRRALAGAQASVKLSGVIEVMVGPVMDDNGLIVGCLGVMKLRKARTRRLVSPRGRTGFVRLRPMAGVRA